MKSESTILEAALPSQVPGTTLAPSTTQKPTKPTVPATPKLTTTPKPKVSKVAISELKHKEKKKKAREKSINKTKLKTTTDSSPILSALKKDASRARRFINLFKGPAVSNFTA